MTAREGRIEPMRIEETNTGPWYRHFWPWFLVGLLGISVVASLWTVNVAFSLGDLSLPAEANSGVATDERH